MKIAFLADPLDTQYAGIHVFCRELLAALSALKTEHEFVVFRSTEKNEFPNLTELAFPIKDKIPMHHRWRQFTSIPAFIKKNDFDIAVELAHFGPFRLPSRIKRATFIHDLTPITHPKYHSNLSTFMHKRLLPHIFEKSDIVLCNSQWTKSDLIHFKPELSGKIDVVHLGKSDFFQRVQDLSYLQESGINSDYILHVGTIEPRKNIPLLIKAFEQLKKLDTLSNLQLILAGKWGWDTEAVKKDIDQSPYRSDIVCTGYVTNTQLRILYSHARALVLPSFYEGFGLPVLEAMACACPVFLSGEGSLREVGGEAAAYFDIHEEESLTNLLRKKLTSPSTLAVMKQRSLKHAENFSWNKTALTLLDALEKLVISS